VIRGYFHPDRPPHPYVEVAVSIPRLSTGFVGIQFVVDTGAAQTCIHPMDAMTLLEIPEGTLSRAPRGVEPLPFSGIGGGASYYGYDVELAVFDDTRGWQRIEIVAAVAVPTRTNRWIPSLLGLDVLKHFRTEITPRDGVVLLHLLE
jgi:hypothetical protein